MLFIVNIGYRAWLQPRRGTVCQFLWYWCHHCPFQTAILLTRSYPYQWPFACYL